ncbi:hypothetical protein PENSPDRAFT_41254 [Peniophora sp. CONT]|nr:hypothetical protein PENSPDRAFT_41254 [Peniophora sp. CONT]
MMHLSALTPARVSGRNPPPHRTPRPTSQSVPALSWRSLAKASYSPRLRFLSFFCVAPHRSSYIIVGVIMRHGLGLPRAKYGGAPRTFPNLLLLGCAAREQAVSSSRLAFPVPCYLFLPSSRLAEHSALQFSFSVDPSRVSLCNTIDKHAVSHMHGQTTGWPPETLARFHSTACTFASLSPRLSLSPRGILAPYLPRSITSYPIYPRDLLLDNPFHLQTQLLQLIFMSSSLLLFCEHEAMVICLHMGFISQCYRSTIGWREFVLGTYRSLFHATCPFKDCVPQQTPSSKAIISSS